MKTTTYSGGNLFGLQFGLYGYDDIEFEESKESILTTFKGEYEDKLKTVLKSIGLKFVSLKYYSPKAYNYESDNIDLTISVNDIKKFRLYINKYKDLINKELGGNKSYDGYIALTVNNIDEELNKMKSLQPYEPDVIVLGVILKQLIDFEFDINEYLVSGVEE